MSTYKHYKCKNLNNIGLILINYFIKFTLKYFTKIMYY